MPMSKVARRRTASGPLAAGGCGKRYINQWIAQAMDIEPWHVDLDTMDRAELITVFDVCMKENMLIRFEHTSSRVDQS